MKQLFTYLLLVMMAVYAMSLVLPASGDPVIAMMESEKEDQSKTKEKEKELEEALSFQQALADASATAGFSYTDTHLILPSPVKDITLPPPDFC